MFGCGRRRAYHDNNLGGSAPTEWDATNLTEWWRVEAGFYTAASSLISQIDGRVNSYHLTQGTGTFQPTEETTGWDGTPSALLDGTNDFMASGQTLASHISASTGWVYMLIEVVSTTATSSTSYNNECVWGDNAAYAGLFLKDNGSQFDVQAYNWDGSEDVATLATQNLSEKMLLTWKHSGGNISVRKNNGSFTDVASGDTQQITGNFRIGSGNGAALANIRFKDGATYNGTPDDSANLAYISDAYGIW